MARPLAVRLPPLSWQVKDKWPSRRQPLLTLSIKGAGQHCTSRLQPRPSERVHHSANFLASLRGAAEKSCFFGCDLSARVKRRHTCRINQRGKREEKEEAAVTASEEGLRLVAFCRGERLKKSSFPLMETEKVARERVPRCAPSKRRIFTHFTVTRKCERGILEIREKKKRQWW